MEKKKRFISIRKKIILPVVFSSLIVMIVSSWFFCVAVFQITTYGISEIVTRGLEAFSDDAIQMYGILDDVEISDDTIFDFSWKNRPEATEESGVTNLLARGYVYAPEENAFVLADGFRGGYGVPAKLDTGMACWEPEDSFLDTILYNLKPDQGSIPNSVFDVLMEGKRAAWYSLPNGILTYSHTWVFVRQPTIREGEPIRVIGIGLDQAGINEFYFPIFIIDLILMVGITLLNLTVILLILNKLIGRIRRINSYVESIRPDQLPDTPLRIDARDEVGQTEDAVNSMVDGLRDRERMETELKVAAKIQSSMLPLDLPGHDSVDLHADMQPAKEVGGDFYDFFMADEMHLALVIADVSGKGAPAAMFMAIGKTLLQKAICAEHTLAEAITSVNRSLCADNREKYFITVWAGLLNLETNELTYVNAGHNPPYLLNGDLVTLDQLNGTMLGLFPQRSYTQSSIQLKTDDMLYLFTDGVNESVNAQNEFFGIKRLEALLRGNLGKSSAELVNSVKTSLRNFSDGAPQNDDITMLALKIKPDHLLYLEPKFAELGKIQQEIMMSNAPQALKHSLCLVAEELFINICSYAFKGRTTRRGSVRFKITVSDNICMRFEDDGTPFDPCTNVASLESYNIKNQSGGLGRLIAFTIADEIRYEYKNCNILTIIKYREEKKHDDP